MIDEVLHQLLAQVRHVKTIKDMKSFFEAILSPQELAQLPLRLEMLRRIAKGEAQRKIAKELNVSTATVTRGSNILKALEVENPLWWVDFKKLNQIPTEEYRDTFAETGNFLSYREKKKWEKAQRERAEREDSESDAEWARRGLR